MKPDDKKEAVDEKEVYDIFMGYLPQKFIKKAEEELHETAEARKLGLHELRKLIQVNQNEFGCTEDIFTEEDLIMVMRCRKFDVQKTYAMIKRVFAFVKKHRQLLDVSHPDVLQTLHNSGIFYLLPKRDKDGCITAVCKLSKWNPSEIRIEEIISYAMIILLAALKDPMTQVNGINVIYDTKGNQLKYLRYCTPYYVVAIIQGFLECLPIRLKSFHTVNASLVFKLVWSITSPFLPEKFKKRVFIHDKQTKVADCIHKSALPVEYGGVLSNFDNVISSAEKLHPPEFIKKILDACAN